MNVRNATAVAVMLLAVGCGAPSEPSDGAIVIITTDETATEPTNNLGANNVDPPANSDNNVDPPANNDHNIDPPANNDNNVDPPANNDNNVDPPANNDNNVDPPTNNENPPEPCGNGVIDDGETCDGDCPFSCDDGDPCTQDSMSGSPDACTAVCMNAPDNACESWNGAYSGSYYILAEEKAGSIVVNSMSCSGSFDVAIDTTSSDTVSGTATCEYTGSLGGFDRNQSATITGKINPDGTFSMRIAHDPGTHNVGYFNVDGSVATGMLVVDDMSSFRPHPMSAVPWEVTVELN